MQDAYAAKHDLIAAVYAARDALASSTATSQVVASFTKRVQRCTAANGDNFEM